VQKRPGEALVRLSTRFCSGLPGKGGWTEREIFGNIRYMNDRGLERKFDMDAYIEGVEKLIDKEH
jgi:hypothetical protein